MLDQVFSDKELSISDDLDQHKPLSPILTRLVFPDISLNVYRAIFIIGTPHFQTASNGRSQYPELGGVDYLIAR